jgi:hypothetical protein
MVKVWYTVAAHCAPLAAVLHHPQIVTASDKVYGVSQNNKMSFIDVITKADALAFVQAEEEQQERQKRQQAQQQQQLGKKPRAVAAN